MMRLPIFILTLLLSFSCLAELKPNADSFPDECKQGNKASCYWHAKRLEDGEKITQNTTEALNYYKQACGLGLIEGCGKTAKILFFGGEGVARNEAASLPYATQACASGYTDQTCYISAYLFFEGKGVTHDNKKAKEFLFHGCKILDQRACAYGSTIFAYGDYGTPKSPKDAFLFSERGCKEGKGFGSACFRYGAYLGAGIEGLLPKQLEQAFYYSYKGCRLGDGWSCTNAGAFRAELDGGLAKNTKDISYYYKAACKYKVAAGCYGLGTVHVFQNEHQLALELFESSCNDSYALGCQGASNLHAENTKYSISLDFAKKGCEFGNKPSCDWKKELEHYLADIKRIEAEENAAAVKVTQALNNKDYRSAIKIAVDELRSRNQAARVILEAEHHGQISEIDSHYIYNLMNWFTFSHSGANAIVQRELKNIKAADKASQNQIRIVPINTASDNSAESLWEISKRNRAAMEKRNMDWYNRGGKASIDVQMKLAR